MERRKRTSMYDPYREDIVAALEAGKTIRQIYDEIICPALNGGCAPLPGSIRCTRQSA